MLFAKALRCFLWPSSLDILRHTLNSFTRRVSKRGCFRQFILPETDNDTNAGQANKRSLMSGFFAGSHIIEQNIIGKFKSTSQFPGYVHHEQGKKFHVFVFEFKECLP